MRGCWKSLDLHGSGHTVPYLQALLSPSHSLLSVGRGRERSCSGGWCGQTAPSPRARLVLMKCWKQTLVQNDMQHILVFIVRTMYLIFCFCFLPFHLWWYQQLAHGFFLMHLLCGSLKVTTTEFVGFFVCLVFLCINILLKELEWEHEYFAEHILVFYIIFFQAWCYFASTILAFELGITAGAHWSKFPGLSID